MTLEQADRGVVDAVVVYDGRLLMVAAQDGWGLPSGAPQPAESAEACAARLVYELTGYLVDGSSVLRPRGATPDDVVRPAVVCQLLSQSPSAEARLTPERIRWAPFAQAIDAGLPEAVRDYLKGHTPV
ncbi:NUDIX domain-containing protein [Streptomyces sp. NBC_00365]|uniref:NUDIX hydrolase n=1 Tax=Streptomyces sp. NBC_00365 TaxID=2975726 RepID=UPI0022582910|nr:NUDIX domain-containing protein [Streptomyces sp. NBC_00365]MCX5087731.1 NUDIX domain-containing protein [Streptomyces sp. NBC_00365]